MHGEMLQPHIHRIPLEVMDIIFSFLTNSDIKAVATVCRNWWLITKHHKFWTTVLVKISSNDIEEKLCSERLRVINMVELDDDIFHNIQLQSVLIKLNDFKQKYSNPYRCLRVRNSRRRIVSESTTLVVALLQTIKEINQLQLEHLNLCHEDLSSIHADLLSQAVVKVSYVNLACTQLTDEVVAAIFSIIVDTECVNIKSLSLIGEIDSVCQVPPDLLAEADTQLTDEVIAAIFSTIVDTGCIHFVEMSFGILFF